jgi:hypothetical protein
MPALYPARKKETASGQVFHGHDPRKQQRPGPFRPLLPFLAAQAAQRLLRIQSLS